jgi:hypothetical protein
MGRVVAAILIAIGTFGPPSLACAQVSADETVSFYGLTFPAVFAGAERFGVRDYEKDTPGLGYSVAYQQPGAVTTVYIYDMMMPDIPEGPSAPVIKAEFDAAMSDLLGVAQDARSKVEVKDPFWISDMRGQTRLLCVAATMVRVSQPEELASYLCVGGWKEKFIKFRTTGERFPQMAARLFLQAWVNRLWPS